MIVLRVGIQLQPPLLQTYILPSGPIAAPLGPPGISATTSLRPSGQTRVSRRPRISTSTTDPSGITTGPSGNSRSVARTRIFSMRSSRLFMAAGGFQAHFRTRNADVGPCYGKVALACQATNCRAAAQGSPAGGLTLVSTGARQPLFADRYPYLQPAIAGDGIELLVVALEIRRVGSLQA